MITQLKAGDGIVIDGPDLDSEQGGRIYKVTAAGAKIKHAFIRQGRY